VPTVVGRDTATTIEPAPSGALSAVLGRSNGVGRRKASDRIGCGSVPAGAITPVARFTRWSVVPATSSAPPSAAMSKPASAAPAGPVGDGLTSLTAAPAIDTMRLRWKSQP
jgi:hypothetical protein